MGSSGEGGAGQFLGDAGLVIQVESRGRGDWFDCRVEVDELYCFRMKEMRKWFM